MSDEPRQPESGERWRPWDRPLGATSKEPVDAEIGGSVEPPSHPELSLPQRLGDYLVIGGMGVAAIAVPAAGVLVLTKWLGGSLVGAGIALLVVITGVYYAKKRPVPDEYVRALLASDPEMTRDRATMLARRSRTIVGYAIAMLGGSGLAVAFALL